METYQENPPWTVRDAKNKLSEVLRCAREQGPQLIGRHGTCVVVSKDEWDAVTKPSEPLVSWLIKNSPGVELELPKRGESSGRPIPFADLES